MNFPQACINLSIEGLTFRFVRFIDRIWYKLWQIHTMHRNYWLQQENIVLMCREWIFIEKDRLYLLVIIVYLILKLGWSVNLCFMYRIVSSHAIYCCVYDAFIVLPMYPSPDCWYILKSIWFMSIHKLLMSGVRSHFGKSYYSNQFG